jgi:class 3 adenylate cyclase
MTRKAPFAPGLPWSRQCPAASVPLQVRVGIVTGLVVVGDLIGAGPAQEQAVVGETPNLAARLQALAEPGSVVIASSTRRLDAGNNAAHQSARLAHLE